MKTNSPLKISQSLYHPHAAHPVRVIKADQAAQLLPPQKGCAAVAPENRKPAEARLVGSGPDYCDLEFTCACGETTRLRCWTTAPEKAAQGN